MKHDFFFDLCHFQTEDGQDVRLVLAEPVQAESLFAAIDRDRQMLQVLLPWVDKMTSSEIERRHLQQALTLFAAGKYLGLAIIVNGQPAGMIDLHNFRPGGGEIGYWLSRQAQRHGIVTQSTLLLCQYAFEKSGWHEVDLRILPGNLPSQRVAKHAGFVLLGHKGRFLVFRKERD